jgi:hypothetical protein
VRGGTSGLRSRQASVRASRRSRGGGRSHGGGVTSSGVFGGGSGAGGGGGGKSSPQLDRHPSVRYSIRRHGGGPGGRRDGSRTSIDRDSAEASLLADVIAAETAAAMQAGFEGSGAASGTALSAMFQQNNTTPFGPGVGSRAGSRRESPNSNRSSRSDRGGPTTASGPEVSPTTKQEDPSPTRRFAKQRQPTVGTAGSGATTTDTTTDHRSGSGSTGCGGGGGGGGCSSAAGISGIDPYFLLSDLQATQKRPPLSAQRSNPEVTTFGSPDIVGVDLSPRGSREELVKALVGGG